MGNNDISNYNLICKNTDSFVKLEDRLNKHFPQLKNQNTHFFINTRKIDKSRTLEENRIKSNDIINVFVMDNQDENINDLINY